MGRAKSQVRKAEMEWRHRRWRGLVVLCVVLSSSVSSRAQQQQVSRPPTSEDGDSYGDRFDAVQPRSENRRR